jgi:hypothetical protein
MYICYKVYLIIIPCCGKEIEVASFDYYHNAIKRRNQLIETFGKDNVRVEKHIGESRMNKIKEE